MYWAYATVPKIVANARPIQLQLSWRSSFFICHSRDIPRNDGYKEYWDVLFTHDLGGEAADTTLYAANGLLMPLSANSPTGSTVTAFSTFINTRGLMRI